MPPDSATNLARTAPRSRQPRLPRSRPCRQASGTCAQTERLDITGAQKVSGSFSSSRVPAGFGLRSKVIAWRSFGDYESRTKSKSKLQNRGACQGAHRRPVAQRARISSPNSLCPPPSLPHPIQTPTGTGTLISSLPKSAAAGHHNFTDLGTHCPNGIYTRAILEARHHGPVLETAPPHPQGKERACKCPIPITQRRIEKIQPSPLVALGIESVGNAVPSS